MILDGKTLAQQEKKKLGEKVRSLGLRPGLAAILVGEDPASQVYVRSKMKACEEAGILSFLHTFPQHIDEDSVLQCIEKLNNSSEVHGILVQLPLPSHINEKAVIETIAPHKDVDCFHPCNIGNLFTGLSKVSPCTPAGILDLIDSIPQFELAGKKALVVGASNIVGKPMVHILLQREATLAVAHRRTEDLTELCLWADVIVSATGVPKLIKKGMVRPGAVLIDVGIHRGPSGLEGDMDFHALKGEALAITPVPGGVGPMTILHLLKNTVQLAQSQRRGAL